MMPRGESTSNPSELQIVIERGLHGSAALFDELRKLSELVVHSDEDAEAVCRATAMLAELPELIEEKPPLPMIQQLFESVKQRRSSRFNILAERGVPPLARIVHRALDHPTGLDRRDVLLKLKVLAYYGTRAGAEAIVRCARAPLHPDSAIWLNILKIFTLRHPQREWLFEQLSDPLPEDMISVSLLSCALTAFDKGATGRHPFDSPSGIAELRTQLLASDWGGDVGCLAISSLPYVNSNARDELLALALENRSVRIQLYAARVAAQLGRQAGIQWLVRACLNPVTSKSARRHLAQIGLTAHAPDKIQDPNFQARAKFSYWLAERSDTGAPQRVEIFESRRLYWPPARKLRTIRLMRYAMDIPTGMMDPDRDLGVVGSTTDCLFSKNLISRPTNDVLAAYCYAELCDQGLISEIDQPADLTKYRYLLSQGPEQLGAAELGAVVKLSPRLKYPQRIVALVRALRAGQLGWIVLDGRRSRWYPDQEFPIGSINSLVLPIHIGRTLLGFNDEPNRQAFFERRNYADSPTGIIEAFECMLSEAEIELAGSSDGWGRFNRLSWRFDDLNFACATECGAQRASRIVSIFERMLSIAASAKPEAYDEIYNFYTVLGSSFPAYVDALVTLNRQQDLCKIIDLLLPFWDEPDGHAALGRAAYQCGFAKLAHSLLSKIPHSYPSWWSGDEMELLAELWSRIGRPTEAADLLHTVLREEVRDSKSENYGWQRIDHEVRFQRRRTAYFRLFPERDDADLQRMGIPGSIL